MLGKPIKQVKGMELLVNEVISAGLSELMRTWKGKVVFKAEGKTASLWVLKLGMLLERPGV